MKKVFVFSSNEAGRHFKGDALFAVENHGAVQGRGVGRQGSSYAIPVRDRKDELLTLEQIEYYIGKFKEYAVEREWIEFIITPVGCGKSMYKPNDIAPMFLRAPSNCNLPDEFREIIS